MDRQVWRITGHAGMDQIFERLVPVDRLAEPAVCLLLQCLMARHVEINHLIDALALPVSDGPGPYEVAVDPGPPVHYRLGGSRFVFEAMVMTERPLPLVRRGSDLAA